MVTFTETLTFTVVQCPKCAMIFGTPSHYEKRRRDDHRSFFCPDGHSMSYGGKSEAENLREQLAAKEREVLAAKSRAESERSMRLEANRNTERAERSRNACRGVTTRLRNKVGKGVCPCCTAKFKNLAAHMRTEHPNWNVEKEAAAMEAKVK